MYHVQLMAVGDRLNDLAKVPLGLWFGYSSVVAHYVVVHVVVAQLQNKE